MLGTNYYEIGRRYEKVSETYNRSYILGVDIKQKDTPFVVAIGGHHSDIGVIKISCKELVSDKWNDHIIKSGCEAFVLNLKTAIEQGETFPQKFILNLIAKNP
ncbi:hypothetical protein [Aquimarina addita]